MKKSKLVIISFVLGVAVSSLGWMTYSAWLQWQIATSILLVRQQEVASGKEILQYFDDPSSSNRKRVVFMATNLVSDFAYTLDAVVEDYPYLPLKTFWQPQADSYMQYLDERQDSQNKAMDDTAE